MQKISLEQWRTFIAVVDCGGFAQAGDAMYKTQSTVSHSIKKLEGTLGEPLFNVVGRKAVLTEFGITLLGSARELVSRADSLEHEAISNKKQHHSSISLAVDTLFPKQHLYSALSTFSAKYPGINVQLQETVLSRCGELLDDGSVDIGIASAIPKGFTARVASLVDLEAVAHFHYPLAALDSVTFEQLEQCRQVVIRDAGLRHNVNSGWLGSTSRFTVTNVSEAMHAVKSQIGFAWLPSWILTQQDEAAPLVKLKLKHGQIRTVSLLLGIREDCVDSSPHSDLVSLLLK
ncbi:LysR family transcriptional regulator [Paraglaciecola arctica]|uniref:LysR family transcriptional regulator n=1 Tax=Paraglaciecola arctica TaxID=1128911 RepID=UPI001C072654|nr:LysR family transcriptional regulator [Paraglaciecola arctica]MBU3005317.1 LysR family transcriptional regulator [Paraglaciecola arctica]